MKSGNLNFLEPSGSLQVCNGTALPLLAQMDIGFSRQLPVTLVKVAGWIPDGVIGIFQRHKPSGRTMALGSAQPLTEMSTRCISWG